MGITSGPRIESDGLIYCFDPANPRSFSGGSSFKNISKKGRGNFGSFSGNPTFKKGRGRGRFSLDGEDDSMSVPDSDELSGLSAFTIAAWVKPTNNKDFWILSKGIGATGNREFALKLNHSGYAEVIIADESADETINATSRRNINNNEWHYVVATWSGSELKVYVNGGLSGPATPTDLVIENLSSPMYIGRSAGSDYANGEIGTIHIYNTVLSDSDIKNNFINGRGRFPAEERGIAPKPVQDSDKIIFDCLTDSLAYTSPTIGFRPYYLNGAYKDGLYYSNEDGVSWVDHYLIGPYEFVIDWGDGTKERISLPSGNLDYYGPYFKHTYSASGEYTITIDGQVGELFPFLISTLGWLNTSNPAPFITRVRSFGNLPFKPNSFVGGGLNNFDSNGIAYNTSDKEMARYRGVESIPPIPSDAWNLHRFLAYNSTDIEISFENNKCPYSLANFLNYHHVTYDGAYRSATPLDISSWDVSDTYRYDNTFNMCYRPLSGIENWRPPPSSDFSSMFNNHLLNRLIFSGAHYDLTGWNVEDCKSMFGMFYYCDATVDVSGWKVPPRFTHHATGVNFFSAFMDQCSGVYNYKYWDTSEVTSLNNFFMGTINNIEDISDWDLSKVESIDYFIASNPSFDTNLTTIFPSSVRSQIKSMRGLLNSAGSYNHDLSGVFPNVEGSGIEYLFQYNSVYDKDISWLVNDKITSISYLLQGASKVTADITQWDLSNVTNMSYLFMSMPTGSLFDADITTLVQSGATNIQMMFYNCRNENFGGQVLDWDLSTVEAANNVFGYVHADAMPIVTGLDVSKLKSLRQMFTNNYWFNQDLSNWDTSSITDMYGCFQSCTGISTVNQGAFPNWDVSNVTNFGQMFNSARNINFDASSWDVSKGENFEYMFGNNLNMNIASTTGWDVSNGTNFTGMFSSCQNSTITSSYFNNWNVSSGVNFGSMFYDCRNAILNLADWDVSNATGISSIFAGSRYDYGPRLHNNGAWLSNWDVSNVRDFGRVFYYNYRNSSNYTISDWDTGKATTMQYMFLHYWGNTDISGWNTENVTSFQGMFKYAYYFNRDISNWNTSKCSAFISMLEDTPSFNQDISKWDYSGITTTYGLMSFIRRTTWSPAFSKANYDKLLIKWAAHAASGDIPDNQSSVNVYSFYSSSAASARSALVNDHGWSITDRGQQ
jgi:surface protein